MELEVAVNEWELDRNVNVSACAGAGAGAVVFGYHGVVDVQRVRVVEKEYLPTHVKKLTGEAGGEGEVFDYGGVGWWRG